MKMPLEEAIRILRKESRKDALAGYDNIAKANDMAIEAVLEALTDKGELIFDRICSKNLEGEDDEIVVIEISTLKEIINDIIGVTL